ncbi:MAG: chemotaxis protein [Thiotrichales bacterium]
MLDYLIALIAVPALLLGRLLVQHTARRFAHRHPEFGPLREYGEGKGCGMGCGACSRGRCDTPD